MSDKDQDRKKLLESLEITEEIVDEKYTFKVNPILMAVGLLALQLVFLLLVLLSVGGPI